MDPRDQEIDGVLRQHLANLSSIIDDIHQLEDCLRSGRIFLAKTRCNSSSAGACISQISYNRADMSTRGATARVDCNGSSDVCTPKFELLDELVPINVEATTKQSVSVNERSMDPIHWFSGVLVPPSLRHAQSCFRRSLRLVVDLATKRAALVASTKRLNTLIYKRESADSVVPVGMTTVKG
ncbi:unnamed protein product [Schistocephalus solidus]|uniref:Vacuolar ATPase assembly protein VMA22 n=1 Tax=Schistocephalus solidus TaxID=70667 RepID=A0A183TGC9_SCHSO|nr:unnamed protein product [Schistocephalus solidus]